VSFNNFGLSPEVVRGTQAWVRRADAHPAPRLPHHSRGQRFDRHRANGHRQDGGVRIANFNRCSRGMENFVALCSSRRANWPRRSRPRFAIMDASPIWRVTVIHGGVGYGKQRADLKHGVDILAATPGRLLDHLEQGTLHFREVSILVLDEVDRMLDMGFLPDVRRIVEKISADRQRCSFLQRFRPRSSDSRPGCCAIPSWLKLGCAVPGGNGHACRLSRRRGTEIRSAHGVARTHQFRSALIFCRSETSAPDARMWPFTMKASSVPFCIASRAAHRGFGSEANNQGAIEIGAFEQRHEQIEFLFRGDGIDGMRDRFRRERRTPISTSSGSRSTQAASRSISGGSVAEKSSVCRSAEIFSTIRRTSGKNPMSSMRSTSSAREC